MRIPMKVAFTYGFMDMFELSNPNHDNDYYIISFCKVILNVLLTYFQNCNKNPWL